MPYQTLINLYLRDCAEHRKELRLQWRPPDDAANFRFAADAALASARQAQLVVR